MVPLKQFGLTFLGAQVFSTGARIYSYTSLNQHYITSALKQVHSLQRYEIATLLLRNSKLTLSLPFLSFLYAVIHGDNHSHSSY